MTAEVQFLLALLFGGTALVAARRYKNPDPTAGSGIAAWVIAAVVLYIIGQSK